MGDPAHRRSSPRHRQLARELAEAPLAPEDRPDDHDAALGDVESCSTTGGTDHGQ